MPPRFAHRAPRLGLAESAWTYAPNSPETRAPPNSLARYGLSHLDRHPRIAETALAFRVEPSDELRCAEMRKKGLIGHGATRPDRTKRRRDGHADLPPGARFHERRLS